jgi:UDP-N-acetylglucosamine/UDP-N-acetylgalactosamine 4-epimerase
VPTTLEALHAEMRAAPRRWLITGVAGFIGSNLLQQLLELGQTVVGLDSFATGHRRNLDDVLTAVGLEVAKRFRFVEGDIREAAACASACAGVDVVLHQAALGSVPRSIKDPLTSHQINVDGFVQMLIAAKDAKVARFVYASSSSVYGDHPALPKVEDAIGRPLSPYAATKRVNEVYAQAFASAYGLECIGLRYFNVFGRRQDPGGPYAAVIPRWTAQLLRDEDCIIFGDGETSRDFCYVRNVVEANLRAALAPAASLAVNEVYNIAFGGRTTLSDLYALIRDHLARTRPALASRAPRYEPFRSGDIRHSHADISKASQRLGYAPAFSITDGLAETMDWYVAQALRAAK